MKNVKIIPVNNGFRSHGQGGENRTTEYIIWAGIIQRCECRTNRAWRMYGGRGITICNRWRMSFEKFFSDMGPRPSKDHTIDRINNDGNYEPGNCRWSTRSEQNSNRRYCIYLTFRGETKTVTEWAAHFGIKKMTLITRLNRGWDLEKAFTYSSL